MHPATALAATRVWFNSVYHRDEFLKAVDNWLRRLPHGRWPCRLKVCRNDL
jgi:hypothetical protein